MSRVRYRLNRVNATVCACGEFVHFGPTDSRAQCAKCNAFVGRPMSELVEVGEDWSNERTAVRRSEEEIYGHVSFDGKDLSTRKRHREYMRENGLAMATDYTDHWQKKAHERAQFYMGEGTPEQRRETREDVGRVAYELENRRRK